MYEKEQVKTTDFRSNLNHALNFSFRMHGAGGAKIEASQLNKGLSVLVLTASLISLTLSNKVAFSSSCSSGAWADYVCSSRSRFVCELPDVPGQWHAADVSSMPN